MCSVKHYQVLQNEKYGRYLVASKDLDSGEVIFVDTPFAVGPKPDTAVICLGCYCPCDGSYVCVRCGWPCCSAACQDAPAHAYNECVIFTNARVKFQPVEDCTESCVQLDCITPLRILLEKERNSERWSRDMEAMEAHTASRQKRATWGADQVNIAQFLGDHCKLGSRFDKELVQRVCGILEVNCMEVPSRGGYAIRGVYPQLSIAAHNCVPNVIHSILQSQGDTEYQAVVRAAVAIKKGTPLYLSYANMLLPTILRREYLLQSKFFECDCDRCTDPKELGTHMSTLKCNKCDNGVILSSNPLDGGAQWKCTHCEFSTSGAAVQKILSVVQAEIDQVDQLEPGPAIIEMREQILKMYRSVFHPKHSLLINLKHSLAQLYGRVEGYVLDELPDIMLERKLEFCREVMFVLDVVAPGETRMRGVLLYEMHAPLMFLARNEFHAGLITSEQLKERMSEPLKCLEEAARILSREDKESPEGTLGQVALQSIHQLKMSLENL